MLLPGAQLWQISSTCRQNLIQCVAFTWSLAFHSLSTFLSERVKLRMNSQLSMSRLWVA